MSLKNTLDSRITPAGIRRLSPQFDARDNFSGLCWKAPIGSIFQKIILAL